MNRVDLAGGASAAEAAAVPPTSHYRELRHRLRAAGVFARTPVAHAFYIGAVLVAWAVGFMVLISEPGPVVRAASLALVAFASVQAGFIAHEAMHGAVSTNAYGARLLATILGTVIAGVSQSYFVHIHRFHHHHLDQSATLARARPPSLSFHEGSMLRRLLARKRIWLVPLLVCVKSFSYKIDSLDFLLRNFRATQADQAAIVVHAALSLALPAAFIGPGDAAANYLVVTLLGGPYVGTLLLINHTGIEAADSDHPRPFLLRQLAVTRNLGGSWLAVVLLGGTNHHVEHHLFPSISVFNLGKTRAITRQFCLERGLTYRETTLADALRVAGLHFRAASGGNGIRG